MMFIAASHAGLPPNPSLKTLLRDPASQEGQMPGLRGESKAPERAAASGSYLHVYSSQLFVPSQVVNLHETSAAALFVARLYGEHAARWEIAREIAEGRAGRDGERVA